MSSRPQDADDRAGTIIGGKFKLLRLIGRGGMGAVYEAENTWTKRRVATKLLRPEYATDRDALRRFMQEAQSASQIAHPNIIDVLDLGLEPSDGSLYMVQEFLTGSDLRHHLLESPGGIPYPEAFDILVPIMAALVSTHDRGVVHRDLKPENIFLCRSGAGAPVPKLIDFGVSKVLNAVEKGNDTGAGTAIGTPRYMSPEQVRAEEVDGRSDVWSLGVVLYELISGKNPFESRSSYLSVNRVLTEEVPRIEASVPSVPRTVADLLHRALERDRALRPEMRSQLDAIFECPDLDASLKERHRASLLYLAPPADSHSRPTSLVHFSLVTQLTPGTLPTMPVNAAGNVGARAETLAPGGGQRGWLAWLSVLALLALFGIGAVLLVQRLGRTPTLSPESPKREANEATQTRPPGGVPQPASPLRRPTKRTASPSRLAAPTQPTQPEAAPPAPPDPAVRREEGANQSPIVE